MSCAVRNTGFLDQHDTLLIRIIQGRNPLKG